MGQFFEELKRRNVFRIGIAYLVAAWLAIQVVETLFPLFGLSDGAARAVVIILAIGFIPAVILAWVFELTPEGLKRDRDADPTAPGIVRMAKRFDRMILVLLVVALGYFAVDKFVLDPARDIAREQEVTEQVRTKVLVESYGEKSIAVLPFVNMSSDSEQEFFSDGVAEEILNLLAKIPELRVISRSSAFSFKGKDLAIPEIAERLASLMFLRVRCANPAIGFALRHSSSKPAQTRTCGRRLMTGYWTIFSPFRMRSPPMLWKISKSRYWIQSRNRGALTRRLTG